ncbi:MAG TPA: PhzF family phenazine biosynthesis protein [Thermoanaerobaculia bacterium]|nr:PhzF family phenazine biosynthesis protein [Thermoanaerobaculia bacterium]
MKIPAYHIDAFAGTVFSGNPAMVCPLDRWLEGETLQLIARENGLPVTAFFVEHEDCYELRWFTPTVELNLCGHGTVAAAAVIFDSMDTSKKKKTVAFTTKGGTFNVVKNGELIDLDFPIHEAVSCPTKPADLVRALGREPKEILKAKNYLAVYEAEADIRAIAPDMELLKEVDCLGVIVTAQGEGCDFVSRYFAPKIGISEDAATGSTHCTLAPYWSRRLGQRKLHAIQLSQRRGELWCESLDDRVRISARAVRYAEGFLYV